MSFTDRLVLWLHIAFAIFTIGPVTAAIMSTPRYIRTRNVPILRYLSRITIIFTIGSLAVLIAGLGAAQTSHDFSKPWLSISATLFVVAVVLLVLIVRDGRKAIRALQDAVAAAAATAAGGEAAGPDEHAAVAVAEQAAVTAGEPGRPSAGLTSQEPSVPAHIASVERGRIVLMGGIVSVIWLVILVLMVWNS
ncbi:MAG TPA: hypothetical protein VGI64_14725 [Streptosporangiaceae bacterium]